MLDLPCKKNNQPGKFTSIIPKTLKNEAFQTLKLWVITPKNGGFEQPIPGKFTEFPAGNLPKNPKKGNSLIYWIELETPTVPWVDWFSGVVSTRYPQRKDCCIFFGKGNIWTFPKMVVPNNRGFSYLKSSFWGVLEVLPF